GVDRRGYGIRRKASVELFKQESRAGDNGGHHSTDIRSALPFFFEGLLIPRRKFEILNIFREFPHVEVKVISCRRDRSQHPGLPDRAVRVETSLPVKV